MGCQCVLRLSASASRPTSQSSRCVLTCEPTDNRQTHRQMGSTIDDLPAEALAQVLKFVGLKDLFRNCTRVSRLWHGTVKLVLSRKTSVHICTLDHDMGPDSILVSGKTNLESLCSAIAAMTRMTELRINVTYQMERCFHSLILKNAATLQLLDCIKVPFREAVVYQELRKLTCHDFDCGAAAVCPRLTHLKVCYAESGESLRGLPVSSLQDLDLLCVNTEDFDDEDTIPRLIDNVIRLENLNRLRVDLSFDATEFEEQTQESVLRLFRAFRHLQYFDLSSAGVLEGVDVTPAVNDLVRMNSSLEEFYGYNFDLTDEACGHLSRLQNLRIVVVDSVNETLTEAGILSLLTGNSGTKLTKLAIYHLKAISNHEIRTKIAEIAGQTGRPLIREDYADSRCISIEFSP